MVAGGFDNVGWRPEWFVGHSENCFCAFNVFGKKWIAVGFMAVREVGGGKPNMRLQYTQCWRTTMILCRIKRCFESV